MDWQLHSGRHRGEGRRCFSAFWRLAGLLLALTLAAAFPSVAAALVLERPPYLQLGTQTSMVVRWRTDIPSESRLRYGPAPEQLDALIDIPGTRTEHEIEITGLTPDTVYYYAVGTPTQNLEGGDADHFFRTSPPTNTGQRFRVWVVGDSGTANGSAAAVRDAYLSFAGADRAAVWVMLGDNAYSNGTDAEYTAAVFQMYPQILRNTVLWPSPGNHDFRTSVAPTQSGPYFETFTLPKEGEAGGAPSGTEAYYSFDYGNVHFIAIDSDGTPRDAGAPMYSWLELDLQGNDKDFVIAYWHHPPYSKGSHDSDTSSQLSDMREIFVPLLEDYGVDLQLSGHSHSFERSVLIDGHYGTSDTFSSAHVVDGGDGDPNGDGGYHKPSLGPTPHEGTVYSVVGSSGKTSLGPLNHPIMVRSVLYEGSMLLEVEGRTLRASWIDRDGLVRDHFEIAKGPLVPACSDGLDNDGDGLMDHPQDLGCMDPNDESELAPGVACDDGIDNDGDGRTDHTQDPGCTDGLDASEQSPSLICDDGTDNDADLRTDLADPGCDDVLDTSELNPLTACTDHADNDGDELIDFESDPGCTDAFDDSELDPDVECDDGADNDGDGLFDLADPECGDATGTSESATPIALSVRVAASQDDAEEDVPNGKMNHTSSDLEMVLESSVQAVGLRFADVGIPYGSQVLSASLQFTVDEIDAGPVSLLIEGEAVDDATPFSTLTGNITSRPTTGAAVSWEPPDWPTVGVAGPEQRTPDLAPVLQQIVSRPGWSAGSALVLIVTGSGSTRTAESYDGRPDAAPLLEVVYLGAPPPVQQTLEMNTVGSGTVDLSPAGGTYGAGTTVTLTATPAPGFVFAGWSGALAGSTNPETITMDADKAVTATFVEPQFTLSVTGVGSGTVDLSPAGGTYGAGTTVTLTATPAPGFVFAGWSGDLAGSTNPETITMDADKTVTATFVEPQFTLSVTGVGSGTVDLSPAGGTYGAGTTVTLTATPAPGFAFAGWSGDLAGSANPETITMDADKTVTATFVEPQFTLSVTVVGPGNVSLHPSGGTYAAGTVVKLRAHPPKRFKGWSGDLAGSANPATITMDADKTVAASF